MDSSGILHDQCSHDHAAGDCQISACHIEDIDSVFRQIFFKMTDLFKAFPPDIFVRFKVRRQFLIPLWNMYHFFVTYANLDGWEPNSRLFSGLWAQ